MNDRHYRYDVGLSFAGEQRDYVSKVASELNSRGIRVFFDEFEQSDLWGKDLYDYLSEVYQHRCRFCVVFASKEYAAKAWPTRERQSVQARAIEESHEYILPARFDDTPIPGLLDTVHYIDLRQESPEALSELIAKKLGKDVRRYYLPPNLDRLHTILGIEDDFDVQGEADSHARSFFEVLLRMNSDERDAVIGLIRFGCPAELPGNVHIDADLLRRYTGMSVPKLQRLLGDVRSLGFECTMQKTPHEDSGRSEEMLGDVEMFRMEWVNLTGKGDRNVSALVVAWKMILGATEHYCDEHGSEFLQRLDFSQLGSATVTKESPG